MAHKKGQGSSRNGRDSKPKNLGVKRFGGQTVKGGTILVATRIIARSRPRSPAQGPVGVVEVAPDASAS